MRKEKKIFVEKTPKKKKRRHKKTQTLRKKKMSQWQFEKDAPRNEQGHVIVDPEKEAMMCLLTFGKHKGETFAYLMRTEQGRRYLRWLAQQPCTDAEYADAHKKRCDKIALCFTIYERWLHEQQQ